MYTPPFIIVCSCLNGINAELQSISKHTFLQGHLVFTSYSTKWRPTEKISQMVAARGFFFPFSPFRRRFCRPTREAGDSPPLNGSRDKERSIRTFQFPDFQCSGFLLFAVKQSFRIKDRQSRNASFECQFRTCKNRIDASGSSTPLMLRPSLF